MARDLWPTPGRDNLQNSMYTIESSQLERKLIRTVSHSSLGYPGEDEKSTFFFLKLGSSVELIQEEKKTKGKKKYRATVSLSKKLQNRIQWSREMTRVFSGLNSYSVGKCLKGIVRRKLGWVKISIN